MKKEIAEFLGTFFLVFFGCGAIAVAGTVIGHVGIAFAFGLILMALVYSIGPVSGCHVNPAVSFGALVAGRLDIKTFICYVIAQCLGAFCGAFVLLVILKGHVLVPHTSNVVTNLGQTDWKDYSQGSAFLFEAIATFFFVKVILMVTSRPVLTGASGLVIGLTLLAMHLTGIDISGASLNPARSLGPALIIKGEALHHIWLYFAAPAVGAAVAGFVARTGLFD
jgi:aquaporin Z